MDELKPTFKKTKDEIADDAERIVREMMSAEKKKKIIDKADHNDPALMRTFKIFLDDGENSLLAKKIKPKQ